MSKPSISHHQDLLNQANVVQSVKQGQFITYSLNTTVFDEMVKCFMDVSDKKAKAKKWFLYEQEKNGDDYPLPGGPSIYCCPMIWQQLPGQMPIHFNSTAGALLLDHL